MRKVALLMDTMCLLNANKFIYYKINHIMFSLYMQQELLLSPNIRLIKQFQYIFIIYRIVIILKCITEILKDFQY